MTPRYLLTLLLLVSGTAAHSDELDTEKESLPPPPWGSEVELGYQSHSGNSDSESLNARIGASYTKGQHRLSGEWKYLLSESDGKEDKRQTSFQAQSDYKVARDYYVYTNLKGLNTEYGAYFKDYTLSSGLGYQLTHTERLVVEFELGPGYRHQEPNLDEIGDDDLIMPEIVDEMIFRGNTRFYWQALENLKFSTDITMVSGCSNTRVDSELSLTSKITDKAAIKISQSQQYLDRVPPGLNKTDTVFTVNLLYKFN